jgi:cytochrome oxidase Cu insertion factor (SCO1/SenC/PrrC family)
MCRLLIPFACAAAVAVLAVGTTSVPVAQSPRTPIDVSALGPQVGATVPAFQLVDQRGRPRTLASIVGSRGAMLVFVRSADW